MGTSHGPFCTVHQYFSPEHRPLSSGHMAVLNFLSISFCPSLSLSPSLFLSFSFSHSFSLTLSPFLGCAETLTLSSRCVAVLKHLSTCSALTESDVLVQSIQTAIEVACQAICVQSLPLTINPYPPPPLTHNPNHSHIYPQPTQTNLSPSPPHPQP